jgi:hypothetical protein
VSVSVSVSVRGGGGGAGLALMRGSGGELGRVTDQIEMAERAGATPNDVARIIDGFISSGPLHHVDVDCGGLFDPRTSGHEIEREEQRCRALRRRADDAKVGRCRLTVSKPVLKAPLVSAISA